MDERGDQLITEQTIAVTVQDVSDNPPYWTQFYPSSSLKEGQPIVSIKYNRLYGLENLRMRRDNPTNNLNVTY